MHFGKIVASVLILVGIIFFVSNKGQAQNENILVSVNFLVLDDGVTDLTANAIFSDDADPIGEIDPILPQIFDINILIILNQIYSQCNISFQLGAVKALRPELLISPLRPGRTMLDPFEGSGREKVLDLARALSFLDEFALFTVQPENQREFELMTEGPHLTMFVVGADLAFDGNTNVLAVGQLNGRHSVANYQDFVDINNPTSVETIAHEWGHNLGLLHTEDDGLEETDDDPGNLMFATINPEGRGNRRLTRTQCEIARNSPLLKNEPQSEANIINVPQDFAAIQDAISAAAPGATVQLSDGVYEETVFIDKPLTLTAAPGADVTLLGNPSDNLSALVIENAFDVLIEGITISRQGLFTRNSLEVTLRNNRMTDNELGILSFNSRLEIDTNVISDNRIGIVMVDAVDSVISNNQVRGNNRGQQSAGIFLQTSVDILVENNVVQGNRDGVLVLFGSVAELNNNMISGNSSFGLGLDSSSTISSCSQNQINDNSNPPELVDMCSN